MAQGEEEASAQAVEVVMVISAVEGSTGLVGHRFPVTL